MTLAYTVYELQGWMELAQEHVQWQTIVAEVINL
jgi:hypothetical protein